jgi:hypothetical protein
LNRLRDDATVVGLVGNTDMWGEIERQLRIAALWEAADIDSPEREKYRRQFIEGMRDSESKETRLFYWTHRELMAELDALQARREKRRIAAGQ